MKRKTKTTPWTKIKAEYLQGATPSELAIKYKIKAKAISDKAHAEGWTRKKSKITEKIEEKIIENVEQNIEDITSEHTKVLQTAAKVHRLIKERLDTAENFGDLRQVCLCLESLQNMIITYQQQGEDEKKTQNSLTDFMKQLENIRKQNV